MDQDPRSRPTSSYPDQNTYPGQNAYSNQNTYPDQNIYANQNTARRTAGSGGGMQTPEGDTVRDWQRNTWYGPVPSDVNPFDEPEDAPELRDSRSENVNQHMGEFWNRENTGYQYTGAKPGAPNMPAGSTPAKNRKARKEISFSAVMKLTGVFLLLLAATWLVLRFAVFTVRDIRIVGNSAVPADEVIRQSGIRLGDSMLSLKEEDVQRRLEENYYLRFRYLEKNFPSTVVLSVRERELCCWLTYSGILYCMDKDRMVMYETEDLTERPAELVEVKGLNIRSGCRVGQTMVLTARLQETIYSELFLEMKVLGCTAQIEEADLSNPDSLLLVMRNGYTVSLGDSTNIHAKLRAALLVAQELQNMDMQGGTINVNNPESPVYSPSPL